MNKLYVIGTGPRCPGEEAREIISSCDVVIASKRHMDRVRSNGLGVKSFVPISPLPEALDFIRENLKRKKIVVLASGDPLFFGIGRRLFEEFGKEDIEFIPALSSMQLAFAKIKEPWDDALFISLHGRDMKGAIEEVKRRDKVCILTDRENTPEKIAKTLLGTGLDYEAFVCERLGEEGERITRGRMSEICKGEFSDPNLMILKKPSVKDPFPAVFGLSESEIIHSQGLITKDEVRAIVIHKLRLPPKGVLWDIGSGSGSVAMEAARLIPELKIYAIEKDKGQILNISENKKGFSAYNIEIVQGEAPEALSGLLRPDSIFIGGSGGRLEGIIETVIRGLLPGGRVVLNVATIETLTSGIKLLEGNGFAVEVLEVSIARTKRLGGKRHLQALNPIFIVVGEKGREA